MDYTLFARTVLLLQDNRLLAIGLSLVAAVLVAESLYRLLRLPAITGYLMTGLALGPFALGVLDREHLAQLGLFSDIAIGVLLFELGRHLDWRWLRREPRLIILVLLESLAVFFAVYCLFYLGGMQPITAGLLAIIAITTSPVILLPILRESRAEGRVSDWARAFAAVNNALALLIVALLTSIARFAHDDGWRLALQGPMRELIGAVGLGAAAGWLLCRCLRWLREQGTRDVLPMLLLFGAIVATVGTAKAFDLPPLMAVLTLGVLSRHIDEGEALLGISIDPLRSLFVCVLFVQVGAGLNLMAWQGVAIWAGLFLLVRGGVRILVPWLLAPFSGIRHSQGGWLGVVLLPMSSLAVLMVHGSVVAIPELDPQAAAVVIAALSVLELIGPITTRWALRRAGETVVAEKEHHRG